MELRVLLYSKKVPYSQVSTFFDQFRILFARGLRVVVRNHSIACFEGTIYGEILFFGVHLRIVVVFFEVFISMDKSWIVDEKEIIFKCFNFLRKLRTVRMSVEKVIFLVVCRLYRNESWSIRQSVFFLILRKRNIEIRYRRVVVFGIIIVYLRSSPQIVESLQLSHCRDYSSPSVWGDHFNVGVGKRVREEVFILVFNCLSQ